MSSPSENQTFHPGQRWASETEPELGLGTVRSVSPRTVVVIFGESSETREYAKDNAPLRRVRFRAGDTLRVRSGESYEVEAAVERRGLLYYAVAGRNDPLPETELGDVVGASGPEQNLRAGHFEPPETFALRLRALEHQHRRRRSAVRGFLGGRIDLIPHQLYIAAEVTRRLCPRVLLADEVGLGKTIEAALIVHRLLLTGRAQRVLVLVPESLIHQWFVELLRRFNQWFHIFDEERCQAIEASNPDANPFLDDQLVLAGLGLLTGQPRRLEQACAAGWDLLVVDEAHHLAWSPAAASPEYQAVETVARVAEGLLLLTATPEQLGLASHFARLRLLDPDRFYDLAEFARETASYRNVAALAEAIAAGRQLEQDQLVRLAGILNRGEADLRAELAASTDPSVRQDLRRKWVELLLDQHGTGRVMFRNTRATITGFPRRVAHLVALSAGETEADALLIRLSAEVSDDARPGAEPAFVPDYGADPRVDWLAEMLRVRSAEKILLICRTRAKAEAIEAALRRRITVKAALFHEGLTLVKRDRNAAWFAENDGAQLLICSEIGSEGRNFQFAHHLVLFDLPFDPELLEQRLGRLDRIGQREEIQVHVPYVANSPQEVVALWYHRGLNSLQKNLQGGRELLEQFGARLFDLARDFHETHDVSRAGLEQLIQDTAAARSELAARLEAGRDRLLEMNSHRPERAAGIVAAIRDQDADSTLDDFMTAVFDHYNIHVEELIPRTYQLGSAGVFADAFPGLPAEGLIVTTDRARALAREEIQFLTWDHPLVTGALDLLLGSGAGNCCLVHWPNAPQAGLLLEAVYLLECVAPPALHVDRFLPPIPLRVIVDAQGDAVSAAVADSLRAARLKPADPRGVMDRAVVRDELVPMLIEAAAALAEAQARPLVANARREMASRLTLEIERLRALRQVNRSVRPEEIDRLVEQQEALDSHLARARVRLDAMRLILCPG